MQKDPKNITKKKENTNINLWVISGLGILITSCFLHDKILFFLASIFFSVVINYHINLMSPRFNFAPDYFLSFILSKTLGFGYAIILLSANAMTDLYTARFDKDTILSFILLMIANILIAKINILSFTLWGAILICATFIITIIFNSLIDLSIQELLFDHITAFISNLLLILAFGNLMIISFL